jgi:hypothetical protein
LTPRDDDIVFMQQFSNLLAMVLYKNIQAVELEDIALF